ncbi:hypothetical protein [uncultured Roseibium sp.]|uniref:virion core protein, T7 gp14 family n=1 Tax=uncultured Roseibium sp. TaxID=1936171 RepID=UPI002596B75B|nr:hypothetical protein [uncultured Roseibium sp.]
MCDPITLTAVSIGTSLVGGFVQASGVNAQASAEADAAERQALLAERAKEVNQTQASFERKRSLQQLSQVIGNNRAAGAERGLSDTGSLVDVMDDNAFEAAQDLEAIRYRAEGERDNLTMEASDARARGSSARKAGRIGSFGAVLGGVTGAATTLGNSFYRRPLTT